LRERFPDIDLLQSPKNLGFGGGCNIGIRQAVAQGADYVWLVNSDAQVAPDALSWMVELADKDHQLGAVGSVIYEMNTPDQIQLWGGGEVNLWLGRSHHRMSSGPVDFVSGASMLLRVEALRELEGFDEKSFFMYWEDTDLGWRLRKQGWRLGVAPQSRIWHRQSASLGMESPLLVEYNTRSAIRFLKRHAPVPWLSCMLMLGLRSVRALLRLDVKRLVAIWRGALQA
jgi:GT2 family glycosyltransferase